MKSAVPQNLWPAAGSKNAGDRHVTLLLALVFVAGIAMGLPTLRGGFLGGDDIQLVRDHALVNRPSAAHTAELFRIVHRDLYQPIPLLTFAMNFAVVRIFGLAGGDGQPPGTWLFHLTNVMVHAANAVLVCLLVRRMTASLPLAGVTGVLFAVHPMGVETVAWLNGRMTLLATFFVLAAVLMLDRYRRAPQWWRGVGVLVLTSLGMMSKVQVALPLLMLAPVVLGGPRPRRRWWLVWAAAGVVTAGFVVLNLRSSAGIIARGEEHLQGSRIVRTVIALGWYLSRVVLPAGLCPAHPADALVTWSDPRLPWCAGLVASAAGAVLVAARRSRLGWVGLLWFLVGIGSTLPLIPSRNLAYAERYAYLPNIGLYWVVAGAVLAAVGRLRPVLGELGTKAAGGALGGVVAISLLFTSWTVSDHYRDDVRRAGRIAELYARLPGMGVRYAQALYEAGRYGEALAAAQAELARHDGPVEGEARQIMGMARWRMGDSAAAVAELRRALAADETSGLAHARLGTVYAEMGRLELATAEYERCVELLPNYNPGLVQLGRFYGRQDRTEDARRVFEQALANNRFEAAASLGIAEMDMAAGRHPEALTRLQGLLAWMPDNAAARVNAGVCLAALGKRDAAIEAYTEAIRLDPDAQIAVLNLANLRSGAGDWRGAAEALGAYLERHPADRVALQAYTQTLIPAGQARVAASAWVRAMAREPQAADLCAGYAWVSWLGRQANVAVDFARRAVAISPEEPIGRVVLCAAAVQEQQVDEAMRLTESLIADGAVKRAEVYDAWCAALQTAAEMAADNPWPYYVLARACGAAGRAEAARAAAAAFKERNHDPVWQQRVDQLVGP